MTSPFATMIRQFGQGQLLNYTFESKELRFQLFHDVGGRLLSVVIPTDTVYGRTVPTEARRAVCSVEVIDLEARLEVKHDRYFPPSATANILEDAKSRVMLAYGRRRSDARWLLVLHGEYPLLCCLVRDLGEVQWVEE